MECGASYCSSGFHYGVDLAAGCGSAIYAAHAGTVVYAGINGGYGNYIKIDHGGGIGTGYGHIMRGGILVGAASGSSAGQLIAYEGNTGHSFGCHLHFETYVNGYPVNPIDFMAARASRSSDQGRERADVAAPGREHPPPTEFAVTRYSVEGATPSPCVAV